MFTRPLQAFPLTGLLVLLTLPFVGCASSGAELYSRSVPYPEYASVEPVQGLDRYTLCHQERTITIVSIAVDAHLRHGDYFGACGEDNRSRSEAYYREHRRDDG